MKAGEVFCKVTVPAWPKDRVPLRLERCRAMLYLYGFLTDGENERIKVDRLSGYRLERCRDMLYLYGFLTDGENERIKVRIRKKYAGDPMFARGPDG